MYLIRQLNYYGRFIIHRNPLQGLIKIAICFALPLLMLMAPQQWFGLAGLNLVQYRVVAIFCFAAASWILEPIPVHATSILLILFELILISNAGLTQGLAVSPDLLLGYKDILSTFASPIIILFLGGFFLAIAATKYKLDQSMARVFIKPFGTTPKMVMLGLMTITAVFSMFMSNTATTAMMLSILIPVLACMDPEDKGRTGFVLSIPIAANIGGLGTPIGTPPNAIAMKYLSADYDITFSKWMVIGVPFVLTMLLIAWVLLNRMFPSSTERIKLEIDEGDKVLGYKPFIIYTTFAITVLLWLTDFLHGMNAYVVALLPVAVFLSLRIIEKEDLKFISWDVLWLVSGGIALGLALDKTGLAKIIVDQVPFNQISPLLVLVITALFGIVVANFMSNTATANLIIPIIAVIGVSLSGLEDFGGAKVLLLSTTLCVSLGMALPISTPPNALAYSTGLISTNQMAKVGTIVGLIGMIMVFVFLFLEYSIGLI